MNINFSYTLIGWEDYPSTKTPVKAVLLNQMDTAIQFLHEQDSYLYDFLQELKSDKVDSALFDSYLLSAPSFIELSQKVDAFGSAPVTIGGEQPLQYNLMMYSGNGQVIQDSGINYQDIVKQTDLNNYATQEDITKLSSEGMTFQNGSFWVGTDSVDDELVNAPDDSIILVNRGNDTALISVTNGDLQLQNLISPTAANDAATKGYADNNFLAKSTITDHGASKFTLTNTETFSILHQHIYQIGALVFVHLVFRTNAQIAETGLFTLGKLDDSILPQHVHSFTVVPANPGVSNDIRVDPGYIALDGTISFDVTKTYSSSKYTFDITTFYCTDIASAIITE